MKKKKIECSYCPIKYAKYKSNRDHKDTYYCQECAEVVALVSGWEVLIKPITVKG